MAAPAFSPDAQARLDRYLQQVRAALRGHPAIDADEVERDVLSHIDTELSAQAGPVSFVSLAQVLERLGPPDQWVSTDATVAAPLPPAAGSRGTGWRLPLLTIGLFMAGPALFLSPRMLWPLPPLLLVSSLLLARVTVAVFDERREPADARRWLVYPALVAWYGVFLAGILVGPVLVPLVLLSEDRAAQAAVIGWLGTPAWPSLAAMFLLAVGVWWIVLGLAAGRFSSAVRAIFAPFAGWFERRHARRLALAGVLLFLTAAAIVIALKALR